MKSIEYVQDAKDKAEALEMLAEYQGCLGYLGGRILSPGRHWLVQVFFDPDYPELPDGCHYVNVPQSMAQALEFQCLQSSGCL